MFWSKEFWPPNSPDLNPLDYYVWSVVERVTNKSRNSNVTSLRTAIEAAFADIDSATLRDARSAETRKRCGDECASPLRIYRYTGSLLEYDYPVPCDIYSVYFYSTAETTDHSIHSPQSISSVILVIHLKFCGIACPGRMYFSSVRVTFQLIIFEKCGRFQPCSC